MTTKKYVAISDIDKTGQTVIGGNGATYDATYATYTLAFDDVTHGARDIQTPDLEPHYQLFNDITDQIKLDSPLWVTTPANKVILESAAENAHLGIWGTGLLVSADFGYQAVLSGTIHFVAQLFSIKNTHAYGIGCSAYPNTEFNAMFAQGGSTASCFTSYDRGAVIRNCKSFGGSIGFDIGNYDTAYLYNNIAIDYTTRGFHFGTSGIEGELINNAAFSAAGQGFNTIPAAMTVDSNASSDNSAQGNNALINQVATTCFKNPAAYDYHLAVDSPLKDIGFNLTGKNDTDIDGQPWTVPYSIGFDQPGSFTVPIKISGIPINTEVRIYNVSGAELVGIEDSVSNTVELDMPYTGTPEEVDFVLHNIDYIHYRIEAIEVGADGLSFPVVLIKDLAYKNP